MIISLIYFLSASTAEAQNFRSFRNDDYEKVLKQDSVSKKNIRTAEQNFEQFFRCAGCKTEFRKHRGNFSLSNSYKTGYRHAQAWV